MGYQNLIIKEKDYSSIVLSLMKSHLNVDTDFNDDDELILAQMEESFGLAEDYTGIDIADTLNELKYIDFDSDCLVVDEAPFQSIESISYIDSDSNTVTLTSDDYKIKVERIRFTIMLNSSLSTSELTVKFKTGYCETTLPRSIKAALFIKTNDLYDMERTSHTVGVNFRSTEAFERSLRGYVIERW